MQVKDEPKAKVSQESKDRKPNEYLGDIGSTNSIWIQTWS